MSVSDDMIRSYFERWQRLEEEKRAISDDLKELFAEAKGNGLDAKALRAVFREHVGDKAAQDEFDAICDLYRASLNAPRAHPAHAHVEIIEQFDPETGELESDGRVDAPRRTPTESVSDKISAPHQELGVKQQDVKSSPAASGANEIAATFHPDPRTSRADGGQPDTSSNDTGAKNDGFDMAIVGQGGAQPAECHGQLEHQTASAAQARNEPGSASGASATYSEDYVPAFLRREAKPLRPDCLNPSNCAGYGSKQCHACTVAARESEDA